MCNPERDKAPGEPSLTKVSESDIPGFRVDKSDKSAILLLFAVSGDSGDYLGI